MARGGAGEKPRTRGWDGSELCVVPGLVLVALGEVGARVDPTWFPWLAPFGLTYVWGWLLLLLGVFWRLLSFRWLKVVVPTAVLVATWPSASLLWSLGGGTPTLDADGRWSLLTFNVRRLDEFEWLAGDSTRRELASWFNKNTDDVWCLQEFPGGGADVLKRSGWHGDPQEIVTWPNGSGPAIITSFEVNRVSSWMFGEGAGRVLEVDLTTPGGTVRVFNVHLQSLSMSRADYAAVEDGPNREEGKRILALLTKAYRMRAGQVKELMEKMKENPWPVVVAGDFNDVPVSFALRSLRKSGLRDSFEQASWGMGATHIGTVPGLRIDGALVDSSFHVLKHTTYPVTLSDHRPVSVELAWVAK
jgi:vancomycin resistance protein VanJ